MCESRLACSSGTTNVLFICGGAFVGLEDIIAERRSGQMTENDQVKSIRNVFPEDLEGFGLIPEIRAVARDRYGG